MHLGEIATKCEITGYGSQDVCAAVQMISCAAAWVSNELKGAGWSPDVRSSSRTSLICQASYSSASHSSKSIRWIK